MFALKIPRGGQHVCECLRSSEFLLLLPMLHLLLAAPLAEIMRRVVPHLNLLRGLNWETKHWQSMLALLGLSWKSKDSVTLRDILAKSENISANLESIRSLDAQAQSEGVIRKALDELDLWGFQRKFSLAQSKDSSGSAVCTSLDRTLLDHGTVARHGLHLLDIKPTDCQ